MAQKNDRENGEGRGRQTDRQTGYISLFTRVIHKHVCVYLFFGLLFLHQALAQIRDYTRSNYTCTHFLSYDTPVHTWNK